MMRVGGGRSEVESTEEALTEPVRKAEMLLPTRLYIDSSLPHHSQLKHSHVKVRRHRQSL